METSVIGSRPALAGELAARRVQAERTWAEAASPVRKTYPEVGGSLPSFLLDRYAFRLYLADFASGPGAPPVDIPDVDLGQAAVSWNSDVEPRLVGVPSLGIAAPRLIDVIPTDQSPEPFLALWREFLADFGIETNGKFGDPTSGTWLQMYRRSPLYPMKPPAILGPTYFEGLPEAQQRTVLEKHGPRGLTTLYLFLLISHEETHALQRGEPMISEFVLAWLWGKFLDVHDRWYWQANLETGRSFNLERPWTTRVDFTRSELAPLVADTQLGIDEYFGDTETYADLCLTAWLFDHGAMRYRTYLEQLTQYFEHRTDRDWRDAARSRLETRLNKQVRGYTIRHPGSGSPVNPQSMRE